MKFLKNFGWGLLTIVCLPLLLVGLIIFAVYLFIVFFVELVRFIIRFFKGEKGSFKTKEDLQVEAIKKANFERATATQSQPAVAPAPTVPQGPSQVYIQQNYYQGERPAGGTPPLTPSSFPEAPGVLPSGAEDKPLIDAAPTSENGQDITDGNGGAE